MLEILLIRHGQTDWNAERRVMGSQPIGLNATGKGQIEHLSQTLQALPLDHLYASPLQRTLETAAILNAQRQLPVLPEPRLREIEYGDWIGKTFTEIKAMPDYVEYYRNPHFRLGNVGESLEEVRLRAIEFIDTLRKEVGEGRVALVSHADWIKCVLLHYLKIPLIQLSQLRIDNGSVSFLHLENNMERVVAVNHGPSFDRLFVHRPPL